MKILVLNCGSSSLKFQLFDMQEEKVLLKGLVEKIGSSRAMLTFSGRQASPIRDVLEIADHEKAVRIVMDILTHPDHGVIRSIDEVDAVGHRTVHGGEEFSGAALITPEVIEAMERCVPFAPLHNPANITGIRMARKLMPKLPQVGVFDTAFHSRMPRSSYLYGLPYELYEKHGIRRYGFHGTSHGYVAEVAAATLGKPLAKLKLITCHLGNGSSIAAIDGGVSVDTSMGFTPLEGLVMGTRCGDLDPAVVCFLQEREKLGTQEVDALMNKRSGLLGISGVSNDMRELEEEAGRGNARAELALQIFCLRVRKYIGAYAAELGGLDGVVFTGGIGENAVNIRRQVLQNLDHMGIKLDLEANAARKPLISSGRVKVLVIPTNEELAIARETRGIVETLLERPAARSLDEVEREAARLGRDERRELVLLWAESGGGDLATLTARLNHRLRTGVSPHAVQHLLAGMGLMEAEETLR
jgi:acetate kinase